MKTIYLSIFISLLGFNINAQSIGDTITIETFNYTQTYGVNQWSPGIRDTIIDFSSLPSVSYEKVLMHYNIRCKDAKTSSGTQRDLGCGEWDISCNTYLHDSTRIDSIKNTHPSYTVSGFSGSTFDYTSQPTYNYYEFTQDPGNLVSIISENQYPVLSGSSNVNEALDGINNSGKSHYLYTATELSNAGLVAGDINGFLVDALNGGSINFLRVKIKGTTSNSISPATPSISGFTEVYFSNYSFINGSNRIQFSTPYNWNGTDNLIVEFSFTNSVANTSVKLQGETAINQAIYANNGYNINLAADNHIRIPASSMGSISNELTVSFWAFGNPDFLPVNTSIIHAINAKGDRNFNLHLPWSNGRVYFDCGNTGNGYDRIDKAATVAELEGQWHHWAATKNSSTGKMNLYLDGQIWHSGSGKTNPIELADIIIGKSNALNHNYKGQIDEVRIWDIALAQNEISNWMNQSITPLHPNYNNLLAYYKMDEGLGNLTYDLINTDIGTITDNNVWKFERGINLNRGFKAAQTRPNLVFFEGSYNYSSNPTIVLDSIQLTPNVIEHFAVNSNAGTLKNDEIITTSQLTAWHAVPQNVFDGNSNTIIRTINKAAENTTSPVTDLDYYKRYPAKFEILSFVTPYGVNLNLGPEGKTWTFDVTDYLPLFKDKKRMTIERGGQWMEDMDIKFLFIVGTPSHNVLDIQQLWRPESRNNASIINDSYFAPKSMDLNSNGDYFKVRTAISGHGQEGEFIPRIHHLNVDGNKRFEWEVWKECAENPIYPQGGTWVYDRAGWCPGMATDVQHKNITPYVSAGQPTIIDYGMNTTTGDSRYIVNSQLVTYGPINHTLDAAIIEIREPSNRVEFTRFNTMCHDPKVTIQNTGETALTSLKIKYWVNDNPKPFVYNWSGELNFLETEIVTLPSESSFWSSIQASNNVFHVEIESPNDGIDGYAQNNKYDSNFEIPEVWPSGIVIWFKTNTKGDESSYDIRDDNNNIVAQRKNMSNNTQYKDTVMLPHGCYSFNVYDSDDDGISWWANNDGNGSIRVREVGGGTVKTFNGDFGDNIHFNFTTESALSYNHFSVKEKIEIYPNPASELINIRIDGLNEKVEIKLFNVTGKLIKSDRINTINGFYQGQLSISELPTGIYFVKVSDGLNTSEHKIIKE